jgi:ABC-type branched-subunit amino acid transport system ATPase component
LISARCEKVWWKNLQAGAGKTTLFDCISRLYDPGAGSMVFDGRPLASFIRHELASLGIARDCFKRPALI